MFTDSLDISTCFITVNYSNLVKQAI